MEDRLSITSGDSIVLSEEFEIVPEKPIRSPHLAVTPTLNIVDGNLDDLKQTLTEVLHEPDTVNKNTAEVSSSASKPKSTSNNMEVENNISTVISARKVGQSTFYDDKDDVDSSVATEKADDMKPESNDTDDDSLAVSDIDQDCTVFNGVTYLGAANINAPKSEAEIHRNMSVLNGAPGGLKVSVSVPSCSEGIVVLYDGINNSVMARYEIHRILFYARGAAGSVDAACFAFTWSHGESQESAVFQCHVFRCEIAEAVGQVSSCFAKAFQRVPRSMASSFASASDMNSSMMSASGAGAGSCGNPMMTSLGGGCVAPLVEPQPGRQVMFVFEVNMEIREQDAKGQFNAVPKDRNYFKLRCNVDKEICLSVQQVHSAHGLNGEVTTAKKDQSGQLEIDRCFGVLLSPGRHVRHGDMQLLEMVSMGSGPPESPSYNIRAQWDPQEPAFELLNMESVKEYITVAVDLVIKGIREPVRFLIETPVKIFAQNERFWYFSKRPLIQQFFVNLKEVIGPDPTELTFEVLNIETSGELDRNRLNLTLNLANFIKSPSFPSIDVDTLSPKDDDSSDGDEPLLSGTGEVSKECCESVLEDWAEALRAWQGNSRPKQLVQLVRMGIPEALRGEVWQRLADCENNIAMMDRYRVLITKESSCENVIQRDINRTFPAHDFFREAGGLGQDSLYRVSKAYAVYDSEVGYCQGLSFLAATLLLHMPEEQAFCVLVRLMYDYGLRDLYKDGFENLYLRLYQLNSLMEEQLPSLWQHFCETGIATHMFASQWFLTLFTARFPLYFVFNIIDVFLMQGVNTLFQIALALLMYCKKDLLQLDFEGVLKYFRVSLPKKCRTEEVARQLIQMACSIKLKKLKKYEIEFLRLKADQDREEKCSTEIDNLKSAALRNDEEKRMLIDELTQVKDMLVKSEIENKRSVAIINEYKQICKRQDEQHSITKLQLEELMKRIENCSTCSKPNNESGDDKTIKNTSNTISHPLEIKTDGVCNKLNISNTDFERVIGRVRELELELAETKLAHVEAECRNQDLNHQLNATLSEIQNSRNNWPPWLSKTLTSIKEQVATRRDQQQPTFQSYTQNNQNQSPSPQMSRREARAATNPLIRGSSLADNEFLKHMLNQKEVARRRDSLPQRKTPPLAANRNSCEVKGAELTAPMKDSASCNNLTSQ